MNQRISLAIIYGSARQDCYCDTIIEWITSAAARYSHFDLQLIDPLESSRACGPSSPDLPLKQLEHQLGLADAFIVITPGYNYGHVAPLNDLIDTAREHWQAKPVGFISYGGLSGDLRATEQLRLMFAKLHAITLNESVNFASPRQDPCAAGLSAEPAAGLEAMKSLLTNLGRWATALRAARYAMT